MASWVAAYTISGSTSPRGESWCNSRSHTSFLCLFRRASPEGRGYPGELPAATPAQRRGRPLDGEQQPPGTVLADVSPRSSPAAAAAEPAGAAVSPFAAAAAANGSGSQYRHLQEAPATPVSALAAADGPPAHAIQVSPSSMGTTPGTTPGSQSRQQGRPSRAAWRSAGNGGIGVRSARPHTLTLQATFEGIEMQLHAVPAAGGELRHAFVCCRRKRGRPGSRRPPCSAPLRSARCGTATGPTPPWCGSTPRMPWSRSTSHAAVVQSSHACKISNGPQTQTLQ